MSTFKCYIFKFLTILGFVNEGKDVKSLNATRSKRGSSRDSMRWSLSMKPVLLLELQLRSFSITFFFTLSKGLCLFKVSYVYPLSILKSFFFVWLQQEEWRSLQRVRDWLFTSPTLQIWSSLLPKFMPPWRVDPWLWLLQLWTLSWISCLVLFSGSQLMPWENQTIIHYPIGKRRMQPVVCWSVR